MSRIVDGLYAKPIHNEKLYGKVKIIYFVCGVLAALMLFSAYFSDYQVIHMVGSTIGIMGMIVINAINGYRKYKKIYFSRMMFIRELGIAMIWMFLLYAWIKHPYV